MLPAHPPPPPQASLDKTLVSTQEDISVNATQYPLAGVGAAPPAAGCRGRPDPPRLPHQSQGHRAGLSSALFAAVRFEVWMFLFQSFTPNAELLLCNRALPGSQDTSVSKTDVLVGSGATAVRGQERRSLPRAGHVPREEGGRRGDGFCFSIGGGSGSAFLRRCVWVKPCRGSGSEDVAVEGTG